MRTRWLALTGTPGVGKTTIGKDLRRMGFTVIEGNRFARENGCLVGVDAARRSQIVDPARVGRALAKSGISDENVCVLESHWAHAVPAMDAALVVRLRPTRLRRRLEARRWPRAKVRENCEAEALDIILQESVARFGKLRVGELDASGRPRAELVRRVAKVLRAPDRELIKLEIGRLDWSEDILKWS